MKNNEKIKASDIGHLLKCIKKNPRHPYGPILLAMTRTCNPSHALYQLMIHKGVWHAAEEYRAYVEGNTALEREGDEKH